MCYNRKGIIKNRKESPMKKQIVLLLLAVCMCLLTACQLSQPSISISEDGYWIINGEKTDVKAQGPQGEKGEDATVTDENPLGLAFFLKDDGTYVVEIGQAKYLSIITIPATYKGKAVTEIGKEGFRDSSNLTSITIPDSITKIGDFAFYGCSGLRSVTIPDSVTEIGSYAFYNCSGLTSVIIGNSVTEIGNSAFNGCYKLVEIINHSSLNLTAGSEENGYVAYYAKEVHTGTSKIVNVNDYLF